MGIGRMEMSLETFLLNLHFDIKKVLPLDHEVKWDDAPLPYKLYRGLPTTPLSLEVPLTLDGIKAPTIPDIKTIGHFLWFIFGITQLRQSVAEPFSRIDYSPKQLLRRFVPSGGALYPNELYLYLKQEGLPFGLYHYDVAHHCLVLLREGDFDNYITKTLGNRCDLSTCIGAVFISTMFWKNFYIYSLFSYRLQALDTGVIIEQLFEVANRFGLQTRLYYQFLDSAVNHLLGLSEQEENIYAIIPLSVENNFTCSTNGYDLGNSLSAAELCMEIDKIKLNHYIGRTRVIIHPMMKKMNEASMIHETRLFKVIQKDKDFISQTKVFVLPKVNHLRYDLAEVSKKRFSPGMNFVFGRLSLNQLSILLQEATVSISYPKDLDGVDYNAQPRLSLFGCLSGIDGIPDGAYKYDSTIHALRPIRVGDHRLYLQKGLFKNYLNLLQVPLSLHIVGDKDHLIDVMGYRGYRIQQIEAGMVVQSILLAAFSLGLGGHPNLGYDTKSYDEIYKLDEQGKTCLIQILVGPYSASTHFVGSLHT